MIAISRFVNTFAKPERVETTWEGVVRALSRPVVRTDLAGRIARGQSPDKVKRLLPAWSPATFRGERRCADEVLDVGLLVLDYDGGASIDDELDRWCGYRLALHTSWSHTLVLPKFRVVLPLQVPIAGDCWGGVYAWALRHTGRVADTKCSDPSRLYFRPALKAHDAPWRFEVCEGISLDVREHAVPPPPPAPRKPLAAVTAWTPGAADREMRRRLREEPAAREALALAIGARLTGSGPDQRASGIRCPACGARSVWFLVEPAKQRRAYCNHRNTCGWNGPLEELWSGAA